MSLDPRRRRTAAPPVPPPPPPPAESPPPAATSDMSNNNDVRATTATPTQDQQQDGGFKLKFCTVCASNQNRSMVGHLNLSALFPTISFGTGSLVRLPGPSQSQPNVYKFNSTTYSAMHDELAAQDPRLYKANGLLNMLSRNASIKSYPERWQDWKVGFPRLDRITDGDRGAVGSEGGLVDIVITCEERCWDAVVEDLQTRGAPLNRPVHVFNVDIKDNHEEAEVGGKGIVDLATKLNECARKMRDSAGSEGWEGGSGAARQGFDEQVPDILAAWQERWPNLPALWTLAWF